MLKSQIAVCAPKYRGDVSNAMILALIAVICIGISSAPTHAVQPTISPQEVAQHETSYDPIASSGDWCND
jgi:hypothetical protein